MTPKFHVGDRVKALSMMPHIVESNPFRDPKPDRTGDVGVVMRVTVWESLQDVSYLVNFNPDPEGPWYLAPFREGMIEAVQP